MGIYEPRDNRASTQVDCFGAASNKLIYLVITSYGNYFPVFYGNRLRNGEIAVNRNHFPVL